MCYSLLYLPIYLPFLVFLIHSCILSDWRIYFRISCSVCVFSQFFPVFIYLKCLLFCLHFWRLFLLSIIFWVTWFSVFFPPFKIVSPLYMTGVVSDFCYLLPSLYCVIYSGYFEDSSVFLVWFGCVEVWLWEICGHYFFFFFFFLLQCTLSSLSWSDSNYTC